MGYINPADAIPTKQSTDGDWMAWYESLPGPRKDKNLIFSMVWTKRGNSPANTSDLRKFLKEKGFTLGSDNLLGAGKDTYLGMLDTVAGVLKIGATASIIVTGSALVLVGAIIWKLATPESVGTMAGTAAKVYTGGAGSAAGGAAGAAKGLVK